MVGNAVPFKNMTPFFWTRSFNATLQCVGYAPKIDEIIIKGDTRELKSVVDQWSVNQIFLSNTGDPMAKKFVAFYVHNNKVAAVATMGAPAAGTCH